MVRVDVLGHDLEVTDEAYAYLVAWLHAVPQMGHQVRVYNEDETRWVRETEPEEPVSLFPKRGREKD